MSYVRIGALKEVDEFRSALGGLGLDIPVDEAPLSAAEGSPLAAPLSFAGRTIGNRWCIHPMEGWDGTADGRPSEHTLRRWRHFGESGAKLIWGGEAVAVRHDGRANPNQLTHRPEHRDAFARLRQTLVDAHRDAFGANADGDLLVGLQLTHSGRFCRPNRKDLPEPWIAYHHPILDGRVGIAADDDSRLLSDGDIRKLIEDYVSAARMAQATGFDFVDLKCCHGYLGHEFLSAFDRPGPYGGDFDGRTRFIRELIEAVQSACPGLVIGVRISAFDFPPFRPAADETRIGMPETGPSSSPLFGTRRESPFEIDLAEPIALLRLLYERYGVRLFNITAGSPYYNPHMQRPAFYPPSDGYQPPEDPLVGCVRQANAVREIKAALPGDAVIIGSAFSYFQEYLPHVAQGVVRAGWMDSVGIGRLVLSDWRFPAKVLVGDDYRADKKLCRTFSDCTTAPRNGLISGCYPLDPYYKDLPEAQRMKEVKAGLRQK
jgi:2,4-dienoyl-CoA reductase-like NADH-dependent reductase (Old Yellow Enzyme family)